MTSSNRSKECNIDLDFLTEQIGSEDLPEQFIDDFKTFIDQSLKPLLENDQSFSAKALNKSLEEFAESELTNLAESASTELEETLSNALQQWSNSIGVNPQAEKTANPNETEANSPETLLIEQLISFFYREDWSFSKEQGQSALRLAFAGDNGQWNCVAKAREEQQQVVFYSISPITAPNNRRMPISEFLARANYGLIIGNFELSFSDGEIRYKTSIDVEGSTLNSALIKNMVYANVLTMDQYLPGIEAVVQQGMNAEAAITLVES